MSESSLLDSPARVKVAGVYAIINLSNGRAYVGSSRDTDHRWAVHFWNLERGTHNNAALQADYTAHGLRGFVHFVLEECADPAQLRTCEQGWIRRLKANITGYNIRQSKRIQPTPAETHAAWQQVFGKPDVA